MVAVWAIKLLFDAIHGALAAIDLLNNLGWLRARLQQRADLLMNFCTQVRVRAAMGSLATFNRLADEFGMAVIVRATNRTFADT